MAEVAVSTPPRKRSHPDDVELVTPTRGVTTSSVDSLSDLTPLSSVRSIPSPDHTPSAPSAPVSNPTAPQNSNGPATKRRRFTPAEKQRIKEEKEAKEKARQEARAQREQEKRQKEEARKEKHDKAEEERRAKEEATRAKREQLEEKKRAKELELAKKEEEKAKKERSQLRLNAFFCKPAAAKDDGAPSKPLVVPSPKKDQRRTSLSEDLGQPLAVSTTASPSRPTVSDYHRAFLPFELPTHATLAPRPQTSMSVSELDAARSRLDQLAASTEQKSQEELVALLKSLVQHNGVNDSRLPSVRSIMSHILGSVDQPIDLTDNFTDGDGEAALQVLRATPMKYLHFHEDVRPPYFGTFSKVQTTKQARKLARNPFSRELPEANYEYDSEAEWEEPEEGEDLDSELDEDEESVQDADEMDGFLDDEDDSQTKQRHVTNDLEPVNSGLWWQDATGVLRKSEPTGEANDATNNFSEFKMGFLLDSGAKSIDPLSSSYWEAEPAKGAGPAVPQPKDGQMTLTGMRGTGSMDPPRAPLSVRPNAAVNSVKAASADRSKTGKQAAVSGLGKRMVPPESMDEFKAAISGSDHTKLMMIEVLKKQFPKIPKDAITNTLTAVAHRVGKGHAKKWELL